MVEKKNYYTPSKQSPSNNNITLYPSQKLQLLHQRTSLSLAYDPSIGWGYAGETCLYLIVDPESITKGSTEIGGDKVGGVELGLHLRDGCLVDSVEVYTPQIIVHSEDSSKNDVLTNEKKDSMKDTKMDVDDDVVMQQPKDALILKPIQNHTVSFHHHDPISIVLTRPAGLHSVEEDGNHLPATNNNNSTSTNKKKKKRYEADAHASRGIRGMTNSLRAASIGSCCGELKVRLVSTSGGAAAASTAVIKDENENNNLTKEDAITCWKNDLQSPAGESPRGTIESKMVENMISWRCQSRREARVDLISKSLGEAFRNANDEKVSSSAMKVVIRFSLRPDGMAPSALSHSPASETSQQQPQQQHVTMKNIGGLTFLSPPPDTPLSTLPIHHKTPHAYTTVGTFGDHQGVRSWLPTLDSASPYHRCSHELSIAVTAPQKEGLWVAASGEDFGCNKSVCHPLLGAEMIDILKDVKSNAFAEKDEIYKSGVERVERVMAKAEGCIVKALGERHSRFIHDFFNGPDGIVSDSGDTVQPDVTSSSLSNAVPDSITSSDLGLADGIDVDLMNQLRRLQPIYVTSVFSSLIWSPCPSRSIGFAVGPFATVFDPEYFRLDVDEEDNDEDEAEEDDNSPLSIVETARKQGEGIRQLYFTSLEDRPWIHADVTDELVFRDFPCRSIQQRERPELAPAALQDHKLIEGAILAATIGVPNRALSLMRDILALPAYRTSSYTQIWIPNAHMSGSNCGGNMVGCPEVGGCNYFLGGAIIDSCLLPPPGMRLPFYNEGRALQFIQARNAIRGWVRSAIPLGNDDDVGQGYLHMLVESFLMSLYERGHGAFGEGGGKGSFFYTKRYAISSGLNSPNLDFLPLLNIEEDEVVGGGVAIEERGNEHLWRSANNGTETHTSSLDEFIIGQLQAKDFTEAIERYDNAPKNGSCPLPSMAWLGSHQSATFFSNNIASSSALGCGAVDLAHPMGGQMYRSSKTILLNRIFESRASVPHYTRVIRAAFTASFLRDSGVTELKLDEKSDSELKESDATMALRPPFVVCVEEMLKKQGLTHAIFTRALRVMSGPIHEPYLRGSLVDIGQDNRDSRQKRIVQPEGFPNSYVRGCSSLYLRVGAHVEAADGGVQATTVSQSAAAVKGIHLHVVAEPAIPHYGTAFGGPVTLRVIENEGQCREFIKTIPEDGSRAEWGPLFLHARPVSTAKQQQSAAGISDAPSTVSAPEGGAAGASIRRSAFTSDHLHTGGFQALELIRITNSTPLLWIRVDPHGQYNGRINIYMQDACLAEQLFHDGDASGQVEAMRALAERPTKVQSQPKLTNVHDVPIRELPVRVLGDCLRGSVALHCDLPHNPLIRSNAALAIAQWQNNQAPESREVVGGSSWLGLDLLLQYFKERYFNNEVALPVNFRRLVLHKHIAGGASGDTTSDGGYQYLDSLRDKDDRKNALEFADEVEIEEDEEYRVRSSCISAIASIRAQDGMTPPAVLSFLQEVLVSGDKAAQGSLLLPEEEEQLKKKQDQALNDELANVRRIIGPNDEDVSNLPYVSLSLVADALLALCHIHVRQQSEFQIKEDHPIIPLIETCRSWLDWDLERARIKAQTEKRNLTGFGGACQSNIAPCAITALCHMAILKQTTSTFTDEPPCLNSTVVGSKRSVEQSKLDEPTRAQFYVDIFDAKPSLPDNIRAAAAQSFICICLASNRSGESVKEPLGLLTSLELLLDRIVSPSTSPGLRVTLALLMLDACTGRVCSLQRVASFCGQRSLSAAGSRLLNGPLGASNGGDNGSALLMEVTGFSYPAAESVNAGARVGLRLLKDSCKDGKYSNQIIVRVASFASRLWRIINGEQCGKFSTSDDTESFSVCAHDSHLRCTLLALWQCVWSKHCMQLMRAQSWHAMEGTPQYFAMGIDKILKQTPEEKEATAREDEILEPLAKIVEAEVGRQKWRGEMATKAYEYYERENKSNPSSEVGQPLPVLNKDVAWKLGGWVASTAQQRREKNLDGGRAVRKINLHVQSKSSLDSR